MISSCCSPFWSGFVSSSQALLLYVVLISKITICSSQGNSSQALEVNVRFDDGSQTPPGIVEVSIGDDGPWVKVQTSGRDWRVGSVVCRQLGQGPVMTTSARHSEELMDDFYIVLCQGDEKSLEDCDIKTDTSDYYPHPFFLYVQCLPALAQEFDIALIKKFHSLEEGMLFTFVNDSWGPVCATDQNSSYFICAMVCRQLGSTGCNDRVPVPEIEVFYEPVITDLYCSAHAKSLHDCSYENAMPTCSNNDDGGQFVEVACHDWDVAYDSTGSYGGYLPSDSSSYSSHGPIGTHSTRFKPALYLTLVIVIAFCGMLLYMYRRNRAGTHRVFLDGVASNGQSITLLQSTTLISPGCLAAADGPPPPYTAVQGQQEDCCCTPGGDDPQEVDPELPTYEEVVTTSQNGT